VTPPTVPDDDGAHGGADRWVALVGVGLAVVATAVQWSLSVAFDLSLLGAVPGSLAGVVFAMVGGLILVRGRGRRYGLLVLLFGVVSTTQGLADAWVELAWVARPELEWPFAMAAAWYQDTWMVLWMLGFLLLPSLFPDGRPVSPRWARAVRWTTVAWLGLIVTLMTSKRELAGFFDGRTDVAPPLNPVGLWPATTIDTGDVFGGPWVVITLVSVVVGFGSLVVRWRRSDAHLRRQLVVVAAASCLLLVIVALNVLDTFLVEGFGVDLGLADMLTVAFGVAVVVWALAFGLAVLRHRLFAIDAVVTRTVTYGILTVAVVLTYVLVVVGVGELLPGASSGGLSLAATALVAVAFDPARRWLQVRVDRTLFGLRDDPWEVLARMGEVMAGIGPPDESLQALVESVATSLKLPWVAIDLHQHDARPVRAEYGTRATVGDGPISLPLVHQDVEVGRLLASPRSAGEPLSPADLGLLTDIARQAGAVAATARLTLDLQRSRERLVVAREEERRRIRRDLHDGLGPSLDAQGLALAAAAEHIDGDPERARSLLLGLKRETQLLVAEVRRIVHGLQAQGLSAPEVVPAGAARPGAATTSRRAPTASARTPRSDHGHPREVAHG
jgi:signal transduction histidine kinase